MFPLLCKDGLVTPYLALVTLHSVFVYKAYLETSQRSTLTTMLVSLAPCQTGLCGENAGFARYATLRNPLPLCLCDISFHFPEVQSSVKPTYEI